MNKPGLHGEGFLGQQGRFLETVCSSGLEAWGLLGSREVVSSEGAMDGR